MFEFSLSLSLKNRGLAYPPHYTFVILSVSHELTCLSLKTKTTKKNNRKPTILLLPVGMLSLFESCSDQQVQGTAQKQGSLSPAIQRPATSVQEAPRDRRPGAHRQDQWRRRAGTVPSLLHHGQLRPNGTRQTTGLSATITLHHHLTCDPPLTPTPPPTTSSAPPPPPTESTSRHRASLCVSPICLSFAALSVFPRLFLSFPYCLSVTPTPITSLCLSVSPSLSFPYCLSVSHAYPNHLSVSVCLSPSLSFPYRLSVSSPPPVCLSLTVSPPLCLSITVCLSTSLSFPYCLSVHLFVFPLLSVFPLLFVCLSPSLFVFPLLSVCFSPPLYFPLIVCLSLSLSPSLFIFPLLSVCLSLSLPLSIFPLLSVSLSPPLCLSSPYCLSLSLSPSLFIFPLLSLTPTPTISVCATLAFSVLG